MSSTYSNRQPRQPREKIALVDQYRPIGPAHIAAAVICQGRKAKRAETGLF